ncbi:hypothetical protein GMRT_16354 [Giardia muris]|uniref:Uncharacterized protein n=1 Tax=Giardia muris TaxID=5742 RepID=A0A4Z1TB02_GIAMU|nr:hypothetical protein GMRT_16354 [Giardia muris]|eukprot:TNJ29701.1 hypothetical protein GMRT_16354 [Giardia muris]
MFASALVLAAMASQVSLRSKEDALRLDSLLTRGVRRFAVDMLKCSLADKPSELMIYRPSTFGLFTDVCSACISEYRYFEDSIGNQVCTGCVRLYREHSLAPYADPCERCRGHELEFLLANENCNTCLRTLFETGELMPTETCEMCVEELISYSLGAYDGACYSCLIQATETGLANYGQRYTHDFKLSEIRYEHPAVYFIRKHARVLRVKVYDPVAKYCLKHRTEVILGGMAGLSFLLGAGLFHCRMTGFGTAVGE